MRTKLERTPKGLALVIPPEMLEGCGIRAEADVTLQNGALVVTAPGWRPRRGWAEALAQADPGPANGSDEDEETLAHWNSLPAVPETPDVQPDTESAAFALRETPKSSPKHGRPPRE